MLPLDVQTIKQNLNKACRLVRPTWSARELFFQQLVNLLGKTSGNISDVNSRVYLENILKGTCYSSDFKEAGTYNSPVCYANTEGLREEFKDSDQSEMLTSINPVEEKKPDTPMDNHLPGKPGLREALQLTKNSIWEILINHQRNPPIDSLLLEKEINKLISQLYELSPEDKSILVNLKP